MFYSSIILSVITKIVNIVKTLTTAINVTKTSFLQYKNKKHNLSM